ncbi:MAG: WYL domain-containing protein, partial [Thermogutta sp.]|uniref:WYL domain-containing protein n=1 Tax=Thermogutta sp. TaxID=1962930 RepID=UPI00198A6713
VGWSPGKKEIRHWKVNRISRAEVTDRRFEMPNDFRLDEHFAGSFGVYQGDGDYHIRVRFSPEVARYVSEARWHVSQQLHPQRDGSLIAEFDLESLEEIERWILSFGRYAEVLEPPELVERIRYEVEQMTQVYNLKKDARTLTLHSSASIFEAAMPEEEPFLVDRMKDTVSRAQK